MAFRGAESFGRSTTVSQYSEYIAGGFGGIDSIRTDGPWSSGVSNYCRFTSTLHGFQVSPPVVSGGTCIIQGRMRFSSLPIACRIFGVREGTTFHTSIQLDTDGKLTAFRGDLSVSLGATAAGVILPNVWQYFRIKIVIHDTTGSVYISINGSQVLNLTNQDTRSGLTGVWDNWFLVGYNNNSISADFTDLYWADGSGSAPGNDVIQECRVEWIQASAGNGNSSQSTPSTGTDRGAMVDDTPSADDDSTYNTLSVVGNKDTVPCTDLIATGSVFGVHIKARAKKTDSSAIGLTPVVRIAGTDYDLTGAAVGTTYGAVSDARELSPATTSVWNVSMINAMEIGYKMLSI